MKILTREQKFIHVMRDLDKYGWIKGEPGRHGKPRCISGAGERYDLKLSNLIGFNDNISTELSDVMTLLALGAAGAPIDDIGCTCITCSMKYKTI